LVSSSQGTHSEQLFTKVMEIMCACSHKEIIASDQKQEMNR